MTVESLMGASRAALRRRLEAGHAIDPTALDDTLYRGVSLGLPRLVEKMTWKTFFKAFHRDPAGHLRGWNVRAEQHGVEGPWVPRMRGDTPRCFGHFRVLDGVGPEYGPASAPGHSPSHPSSTSSPTSS